MPAYTYIERQQQLDLALTQLSRARSIAVDTESSGFYTYFTELCLIQLSADKSHYIIDVLAGLNLDGLGKIFADPDKVIILHGASSDIAEMRRTFNWEFRNIFDTLLACRMLGHESCSLAALAKEYAGVELQKKEQKSNWKKRPLTKSQLDYAHLDTVYLEEIMNSMVAQLDNPQLLEELRQEFMRAARMSEAHEKIFDAEQWIKLPGALALDPVRRGILKKLYEIREMRARKDNISSFRLLTNEGLVRIVEESPASMQRLQDMGVANPLFLKKEGHRLLEALRIVEPIKDSDLPKQEETDPWTRDMIKSLKKWRLAVAEYRGMDTSMIINNRALAAIVKECPQTIEGLAKMDLMTDWKLERYGEQILKLLRNEYNGEMPPGLVRVGSRQPNA